MSEKGPHVFGDKKQRNINEVNANWQAIKAEEKVERHIKRQQLGLKDDTVHGYLSKVKTALPPVKQAMALQNRAAQIGFDWTTPEPIFEKISEELLELQEAEQSKNKTHIEEEFGDLYFVMLNLARRLELDPEKTLSLANKKFRTRFAHIENGLEQQNVNLENASLEQMEKLWQDAKKNS